MNYLLNIQQIYVSYDMYYLNRYNHTLNIDKRMTIPAGDKQTQNKD